MLSITLDAVQRFDDFHGEVELHLATTGRQPDLQAWGVINVLIGDMILLRNGNTAPAFGPQLETRIRAVLEDAAVFALLAVIADRKIRVNSLKG